MLADNLVNSILAKTEPTSSDGKGLYTFLQACVLLSCKMKHSHFVNVMEKTFSASVSSQKLSRVKAMLPAAKLMKRSLFCTYSRSEKNGHT